MDGLGPKVIVAAGLYRRCATKENRICPDLAGLLEIDLQSLLTVLSSVEKGSEMLGKMKVMRSD